MYPCPLGYCRCVPIREGNSLQCRAVYNSLEPDTQCICERRGYLCGECRDGKGVSALLSRCTTCSNASGLLIVLLLVLDLAVFLVLLVIMKPFPSWAYPCVFYIQVLPYLTEHFPTTFEQIHPALYYISSALSFYFIYDFCLYSDMSPLVSYFLRYLPLFLAIATVTFWSALMSKFTKKTVAWHGLWWIILLMYSHVLHTSMSILNCPILPETDSSDASRWYVSGNIKCFGSEHAALGLLAIVILSLSVAVIPLSLVYNMGWLKRPWILKRIFEPLMEPYKMEYKWWASVELSRRFFLILFTISLPSNEYLAIVVLILILGSYGFAQPFRLEAANVLEVVLSIDALILLLLRDTTTVEDEMGMPSIVEASQIISSNSEGCTDALGDVTDFAWLLFPFYYFILLVTSAAAITWIVLIIRSKVYAKWYRSKRKSFEVPQDAPSFQKPVATASTTEVVMSMEMSTEEHHSSVTYSNVDHIQPVANSAAVSHT
jgi:hypothetical protein